MKAVRAALLLVTLLVLQTTVAADLPVLSVRADFVLLATVAAGIAGGRERGAQAGFAAGLGYDLLVSQTPVGLYALAYCLTGYVVGAVVQGTVLRVAWWIPVFSALVASAAGVVLFAVLGTVLGQDGMVDGRLLRVALVVAVLNAIMVLPMLRIVRWSLPAEPRARLA